MWFHHSFTKRLVVVVDSLKTAVKLCIMQIMEIVLESSTNYSPLQRSWEKYLLFNSPYSTHVKLIQRSVEHTYNASTVINIQREKDLLDLDVTRLEFAFIWVDSTNYCKITI